MSDTALVQPRVLPDTAYDRERADAAPWQGELPLLATGDVTLREVRATDARALAALLSAPEIGRYLSPPPSSIDGFERFIAASLRARATGDGACFAVTLREHDAPIGLFQVRLTTSTGAEAGQFGAVRDVAEWGFALATAFWGTGVFPVSAALVLDFVFEQMKAHRLEARCAIKNGRGGRALLKVGAVPEGVLRKSLRCGDEHLDQVLYAIVADDWRECRDRCRSVTVAIVH